MLFHILVRILVHHVNFISLFSFETSIGNYWGIEILF